MTWSEPGDLDGQHAYCPDYSLPLPLPPPWLRPCLRKGGVYSSAFWHLTWSTCRPTSILLPQTCPFICICCLGQGTMLPRHPTQRPRGPPGLFTYFPNLLSHQVQLMCGISLHAPDSPEMTSRSHVLSPGLWISLLPFSGSSRTSSIPLLWVFKNKQTTLANVRS